MNPTRSGNFFNAGATPRSVGALYPDPWVTISSTTDPQTIPHLLIMAERLLRHNPLLARAYRRVIAFLVTKVVVKDCSDDEKKKYIEFLYDRVRVVAALHAAAYDYMSVGNYFGSLTAPFTRYLMCKACKNYQAPIDQINYEWSDYKFIAKCPKCHRRGEWHRWEMYNQDQTKMQMKRWSPHEMEIKYIETTNERIYFWKLNPTIRAAIKRGDQDYLKSTPWVIIECVKNNNWLKFGPNQIIHLYNEPPAGWRTGGWGIPDCLQLKPELYQLQVCRRHNEAICHEGIIPMKFLSPQTTSKIGVPGAPNIMDPSVATSLSGNFITSLQQALSRRRNDPYGVHVLPHGVNYQQIGGDAKNLVPKDITDQNIDYVLNAAGIPVNFYKADFTTQGAPMALRAVQSSWSHLVDNLDQLINFIMGHCSRILQIEPAQGSLARPSDVDDINRTMARLNLMSGGAVSPETGLEAIGLDAEEEQDRTIYGQQQLAKKQKEAQKAAEREGITDMMNQGMVPAPAGQQQQGGAQGGQPQAQQGGPPPITDNPQLPRTPQDMTAEAQAWAAYLLPLSAQNRQAYQQYLLQLRQKDPTLHQIVMATMEDQRQQLGNQGRDMLLGGGQPQ